MGEKEKNGRLGSIMEYFSVIPDPRHEINRKYPLYEVVAITILAVMSFAHGWEDIERYGKAKKQWLSKFLELKNGIPKHDVYRRVFTVLKPELIEACFMNWVRAIKQKTPMEHIVIDGKTVKGAFNAESVAYCQCLGEHKPSGVWSSENR